MSSRQSSNIIARAFKTTSVYVFILVYFVVVVFPLLWMFFTSFKTSADITTHPWMPPISSTASAPGSDEGGAAEPDTLLPRVVPTKENYQIALSESHLDRYFLNSTIVVLIAVLGALLLGSMAAYALARFTFPGRELVYLFFISAMMVPPQLSMPPLFMLLKTLGLLNTYTGLILVYIARSLPFTIFLLRGFFATLPNDMRESGLVEGASEWKVFWLIMFPLARPGLLVVTIFNFLWLWNEYLFALLIMAKTELQTLPLGIANMLVVMEYRGQWGAVFAGLTLILMPTLIIYLILHRRITAGLTAGAVKG
jgi:N-acetylglucosamine transport system permease protein